jgi:Protein of unknown function (DUF4238)
MTDLLPKHHYIPVLYLKQWAVNGRFTEFSRPAGHNRVEPRGTGPRGTGYKRGLYRIMTEGLPEELAERVERQFMQTVDNLAKDALDIILANAHDRWTLKTPERVETARRYLEDFWLDDYDRHEAEYNADKGKDDPDFLDYVIDSIGRRTLEFTVNQIDNMNIGRLLNSMQWRTADVSMAGRPPFTSDRPVIYSNGLAHANSHLVLPVSPTCLSRRIMRLRHVPCWICPSGSWSKHATNTLFVGLRNMLGIVTTRRSTLSESTYRKTTI